MNNSLMTLPLCPRCGVQMEYRPPKSQNEAYCGVWYDCHNGKCSCSTLLPSVELKADWAAMQERRKKAVSEK